MPRTIRVETDPVVLTVPVYETATTLTDGEDDAVLPPPSSAVSPAASVFTNKMVRYGIPGLLLGTLGNALVAGLAFRSYRNTGSVVRPAVIIGVGGLVVSGASLLLLLKAVEQSDQRLASMGTGLWLAK